MYGKQKGNTKKCFLRFAIRIRTLVKYNAFRPKGEKLHQHFFTIHYYLLFVKKRQEALVKRKLLRFRLREAQHRLRRRRNIICNLLQHRLMCEALNLVHLCRKRQ